MRYLSVGYPHSCRPTGCHSKTLWVVEDLLKRFGQRIRQLRTQKGWSQEAFADVCGVHRTYMGHLERGEKNVSFRSILRIADALGITLSEFFVGLQNGGPEEGDSSGPIKIRLRTRVSEEVDRARVLREMAALERNLASLKAAVLAGDDPMTRRKPSRRKPNS
jgi:transcriptional regulator with XRE-family HTH domain